MSLVIFRDKPYYEFIDFLKKYSYNGIPKSLIESFEHLIENIKSVSLELGKSEIILKVMKGDLSFLIDDKKFTNNNVRSRNNKTYVYPREKNYKVLKLLSEKDVNIVFPSCNYANDIEFTERKKIKLRYYQEDSYDALVNRKAGLTIMPVNSGKSYVAIELIKYFKKETLILCEHESNCYRWRDLILDLIDINKNDIAVCAKKNDLAQHKKINIYSYDILRNAENGQLFERLNKINWGIIIYDNAHKAVTDKAIDLLFLKAIYKFAFDSTINRSDGREINLLNLFGGVTYNITSQELVKNLFQKELQCFKVDLTNINLTKLEYANRLLFKNKEKKIVVVAHYKKDIEKISNKLNLKCIYSSINKLKRRDIINRFNNGKINRLCISNLIEKYHINDLDIMIVAGYRSKYEIEELFKIGTLVGITSQLNKITKVQMYYLIENKGDLEKVIYKEARLKKYGINMIPLGVK